MSTRQILTEYRAARAAAAVETATRRDRVLKHPDLRERLTEQPLNYSRPEQWNGWVPPKTLPEDACDSCPRCRGGHGAAANDSPRRAALIDICAEALHREKASPAVGE